MKISQPLTKEMFWDEIEATFPKSMKLFLKWIDEYKEAVCWNGLFGEHETKNNGRTVCSGRAPKFHEIPYEMQQGIWIKFAMYITNEYFEQSEYEYSFDLEEDIKMVFGEIEPLIDED